MSQATNPEGSRSVWTAIKDSLGLFSDTNKAQAPDENYEGIPQDEYESSLKEDDILDLVALWQSSYSKYYDDISKSQEVAFDYWIGKQRSDGLLPQATNSPSELVDNLIFEAVETFLPIATRANPDPLVTADPGESGQGVAKSIKAALVNEADRQKLRRKLARMTRHWALYRLGVAKVSWNPLTKQIQTEIINARRMIFDFEGHIDEGGRFVGEYLGEKKKATAEKLIQMFPKASAYIKNKVTGKLGTKLEFVEWWYNGRDLFYTLDDKIVLGKFKNPNWNWDKVAIDAKEANEETGDPSVDGEEGSEGVNLHKEPMAPYVFLSVFSTGLHPHDDTSLILQNIPLQDLVNRRLRQIDKNVESQNNGMVVSGDFYTEEQASQASSALRRGVTIRQPKGDVTKGAMRLPAPQLPRDISENLTDARNELRNIFGTAGSTPEGTEQQKTVRGKIMVSQQDSSRIGGGVTEQIEQVADAIYNWWVQFMFVYYDEEHFEVTAGQQGGLELAMIKNTAFTMLESLNITVKEGSLIPKDPLTQRNEAIDLWSANAIDPLNFYKKLDFPDPVQATQQLILWQMLQKGQVAPQAYLPSFQIPGQQQGMGLPMQQPGTGGPAVSQVNGPNIGEQSAPPDSNPAIQQQSQQLIQSVPLQQ